MRKVPFSPQFLSIMAISTIAIAGCRTPEQKHEERMAEIQAQREMLKNLPQTMEMLRALRNQKAKANESESQNKQETIVVESEPAGEGE